MRLVSRGDTIVEVLFAITVFAMVAVGSLMIMNQGTATAQRALEINLVRQQIDAQAEAIRFIHQSYVTAYQRDGTAPGGLAAEWSAMVNDKGVTRSSDFGAVGNVCPTTVPARSFIVNARLARVASATPQMSAPAGASLPPFSQTVYNNDNSLAHAYGIWVEAVPANVEDGPSFVDFHIRACWESAGSRVPTTLGTIVRLYEPR